MSITREWGNYVALLGLVKIFDIAVAAVSSLGEGLSIIYPSNHSQEEADFDSIEELKLKYGEGELLKIKFA